MPVQSDWPRSKSECRQQSGEIRIVRDHDIGPDIGQTAPFGCVDASRAKILLVGGDGDSGSTEGLRLFDLDVAVPKGEQGVARQILEAEHRIHDTAFGEASIVRPGWPVDPPVKERPQAKSLDFGPHVTDFGTADHMEHESALAQGVQAGECSRRLHGGDGDFSRADRIDALLHHGTEATGVLGLVLGCRQRGPAALSHTVGQTLHLVDGGFAVEAPDVVMGLMPAANRVLSGNGGEVIQKDFEHDLPPAGADEGQRAIPIEDGVTKTPGSHELRANLDGITHGSATVWPLRTERSSASQTSMESAASDAVTRLGARPLSMASMKCRISPI